MNQETTIISPLSFEHTRSVKEYSIEALDGFKTDIPANNIVTAICCLAYARLLSLEQPDSKLILLPTGGCSKEIRDFLKTLLIKNEETDPKTFDIQIADTSKSIPTNMVSIAKFGKQFPEDKVNYVIFGEKFAKERQKIHGKYYLTNPIISDRDEQLENEEMAGMFSDAEVEMMAELLPQVYEPKDKMRLEKYLIEQARKDPKHGGAFVRILARVREISRKISPKNKIVKKIA